MELLQQRETDQYTLDTSPGVGGDSAFGRGMDIFADLREKAGLEKDSQIGYVELGRGLGFPQLYSNDRIDLQSPEVSGQNLGSSNRGQFIVDYFDRLHFTFEIPDNPSTYAGICGGLVLCIMIQSRRAKRGGKFIVFKVLENRVQKAQKAST